MGGCRTVGIRKDKKRDLYLWFRATFTLPTVQPSYLYEAESPLAKPVYE